MFIVLISQKLINIYSLVMTVLFDVYLEASLDSNNLLFHGYLLLCLYMIHPIHYVAPHDLSCWVSYACSLSFGFHSVGFVSCDMILTPFFSPLLLIGVYLFEPQRGSE